MELFLVLVTVAVLILVVVGAVIGVRHLRHVAALRARGWQFDGSPDISIVHGLNCPPFGIGFDRRVDNHITGAAPDGTAFQAFTYRSDRVRPSGYVVAMPLPGPLAPEAVEGAATPLLEGEALSVDHLHLVLTGVKVDADALAGAITRLSAGRAALLASPSALLTGPTAPAELSVAGHDDWVYRGRQDQLLSQLTFTGGGFDHEAHDIVFSPTGPVTFLRLTHRWKTRETSTDAKGNVQTRVSHHDETLCEFIPQFPFADLSANWGLFGRSQSFELEEFNRRVRIQAPNRRFASDVIHQRTMEYLLSWNAPSFQIEGGRIRFAHDRWLTDDLEQHARFLAGFLARVPDHVYGDLGAWPRPVPRLEQADPR